VKILLVHNEYGKLSGEEVMFHSIAKVLQNHGHEVTLFTRSSTEIKKMFCGRIRAFFTGLYNFNTASRFAELIKKEKPDIVQIQNVYPLISPVVFKVAHVLGIPLVFRCANYRLFCPSGLMLNKGEICERCVGGKEYWCVIKNCETSFFKSFGYAIRNAYARVSSVITENTTIYYVLSQFQKDKFVSWGIPSNRIVIIPNFIEIKEVDSEINDLGKYVGYVGRVSQEKGVPLLVDAISKSGNVPLKIAGDYTSMPTLPAVVPTNVTFLGQISMDSLNDFYANARIIVVPSIWYETFGMVVIEAMLHKRPVIGARVGAIQDTIQDGVTGFLFEPGNSDDLASKIRYLWEHPDLCHQMGQAGREKALREYSPEKYYERLMAVYKKAIKLGTGNTVSNSS